MSEEKNKRKPPSFSGSSDMTHVDPQYCRGDGSDETTRRAAFVPCFEPSLSAAAPAASIQSKASPTPQITASTSSLVWKFTDIPTLPDFCPLESTAVLVTNVTPESLSARITDILRKLSIESEYRSSKVKCLTNDGVEFRIFLYRGKGRFSDGFIVEVQRRWGFSRNFGAICKSILQAVKEQTFDEEGPATHCPMLPLPTPVADEDVYIPDVTGSLEMVSKMWSLPGYEAETLALNTLSSLTDASKMGRTTARAISHKLLTDENHPVASKVLGLVLDSHRSDSDENQGRAMAMTVLANAMEAAPDSIPVVLKELLHDVILQELRVSEQRPRMATQAARMAALYEDETTTEWFDALESALQVGKTRYADLERWSQFCLDKLSA
jgi:hypothetical protein